jgi:LacI family transcriptional regulator
MKAGLRMRRVTLADVAQAAGVGVATVSRALGEHADVSNATRERVREAAMLLGYRPSVTARALRSGGFHAISAVVPDAGWGWWEPVVQSASTAAAAAGYQLMVHPVAGATGGVTAVLNGLANVPTEGVIIISVPDQQAAREACDRISLPAVAIDDTSRDVLFPTVSAQNRLGARSVVEHLLSMGHESIAVVTGSLDAGDDAGKWGDGLFMEERLAGYRDALTAAGLTVDADLVVSSSNPFDERRETWPEFEALLDRRRIDAVFCVADLIAAPILRTLRRRGLRVPEDVAVAGFDDERAALLLDPQLTTARQPYQEMGASAVELLLASIAGERTQPGRHELPTELVVRASSGQGAVVTGTRRK